MSRPDHALAHVSHNFRGWFSWSSPDIQAEVILGIISSLKKPSAVSFKQPRCSGTPIIKRDSLYSELGMRCDEEPFLLSFATARKWLMAPLLPV